MANSANVYYGALQSLYVVRRHSQQHKVNATTFLIFVPIGEIVIAMAEHNGSVYDSSNSLDCAVRMVAIQLQPDKDVSTTTHRSMPIKFTAFIGTSMWILARIGYRIYSNSCKDPNARFEALKNASGSV